MNALIEVAFSSEEIQFLFNAKDTFLLDCFSVDKEMNITLMKLKTNAFARSHKST